MVQGLMFTAKEPFRLLPEEQTPLACVTFFGNATLVSAF